MELETKISLASAIIAFISFISTLFFAKIAKDASTKAQSSEEKANMIVTGQLETSIRDSISLSRTRVEDISLRINELLSGRKKEELEALEKNKLEVIETSRRSSIENLINTYDNACAKYIDNKIDKKRFRKSYIKEIENICDHKISSYAYFLHPKSTSTYEAIWKVYDDFYKYEK